MVGQFVTLLLCVLIIGQGIGFALSWSGRKEALREAAQSEFISRSASLVQVVAGMNPNLRRDVLLASATSHTRYWITPDDPRAQGRNWYVEARAYLLEPLSGIINAPPAPSLAEETQRRIVESKAFLGWSPLDSPLWTLSTRATVLPFEGQIGLGLAVPLDDGMWLNAIFYRRYQPDTDLLPALLPTLVTALLLCLAGALLARWIAKPLAALAAAAGAVGRGEPKPLHLKRASRDILLLQEAFNRMQDRLHRFVEDRTLMLAALGHDLRTPITTLRLRAELLEDPKLRAPMIATLDEMTAMANATLSFAKSETTAEQTRLLDLGALVESLCDDLAMLGQDVTCAETGPIPFRCRPDALRRALRNLVENALRYAGHARVTVADNGAMIEIRVQDSGPGVPADQIGRVFEPFYRVESSRSAATGGVGLGLAIVQSVARQHGGEVTLRPNHPGLSATIRLPRD